MATLRAWSQNSPQNFGTCPGLPLQLLAQNRVFKNDMPETPPPIDENRDGFLGAGRHNLNFLKGAYMVIKEFNVDLCLFKVKCIELATHVI